MFVFVSPLISSWYILCAQVDQFIHRILVEEDVNNSQKFKDELFDASAEVGEKLYSKGDFSRSQISNLDAYLLRQVMKKHLYGVHIAVEKLLI